MGEETFQDSARADGQPDSDVALPRQSSVAESASDSLNRVSPLPWRVLADGPRFIQRGSIGWNVASALSEHDAAYIVRACNSYPALVSALKGLLGAYVPTDRTMYVAESDAFDRAIAALKLAEASHVS